jgi:hypothetical protein
MKFIRKVISRLFTSSELPVPRWKPDMYVDTKRTAQSFAYYTDYQHDFVVFKNGTCLVVDYITTNIKDDARCVLQQTFNPLLSFKTEELVDDNWYVAFSGNIVGIVFRDEIEENIDYIEENYMDGLLPSEIIHEGEIGDGGNVFDLNGKIGLLARLRVVMDYLETEVVQVVKKSQA